MKYSFISGHQNIEQTYLEKIGNFVGLEADEVCQEFEYKFAAIIGPGKAVSFGSARMAFFAFLKSVGISSGDEVVLTGFTCAVMASAVIKSGAKPIYADINPCDFGTSSKSIISLITPKTRVVVIQHSFGIPSDALEIIEYLKKKKIWVIEDCALTLGSSYKGSACGTFGDAALFSTDHSKPVNTLFGGLLYTEHELVYDRVASIYQRSQSFSVKKQKAMYKQILFERKHCKPFNYLKFNFLSRFHRAKSIFQTQPFLNNDFGLDPHKKYPYPAKMPAFLCMIGIYELQNWSATQYSRLNLLSKIKNVLNQFDQELPSCYQDDDRFIIPSRVSWVDGKKGVMRRELNSLVDTSWFWFSEPLLGARNSYDKFFYLKGSCPNSEKIGKRILNLPCNIPGNFHDVFIEDLSLSLQRAMKR